VGACLYFDGQVTFPERLALENALDAQTHGAEIRTHTRVTRILESDGVVRGVAYEDLLTGESGLESAPTVINVTGPWVDNTLAQSLSGETRLIGGTKGSHIVVEPFPDAPGEGLYVEAGWDGRPIFIIPWNGLYLIGTTDEKFEGNPDDAKVTVAEAVYLIDEANRVIPNAHLSERSVLYSYAGVRPLAFTEGGKPARISRRHFVHRHKLKGLFSIIGGKLTTYRSLAEKAVDLVQLERGMRVTASRTASTPLPGKLTDGAFSALAVEPSGIQARVTKRLRELYGERAAALTKLAAEKPELAATLGDGSDVIGAEVPFAFREEMARTLIDFMMRRSMAGLSAGNVMAIARDAARVAEAELGWTEARARDELSSFSDLIKRLQRRPPVNVVATRWGF
jgi:glycerol-3-phosphate dehydrogenase